LAALLPNGVVTTTLADPGAPLGTVAVMVVAFTTVKLDAAVPANVTAVAPVKVVPVIVTLVPPAVGPEFGLTEVTVGGGTTVRLALDVFPVPPFVELSVTRLFFDPAVVPVTFTLKVQEDPAATGPPDRVTLPLPGTAVIVPPPHEPVSPFGVATDKPDGRLSVNAASVSVTAAIAGWVIVKLRLVVPLNGILAAPKDLPIVAGAVTIKWTSSKPATEARPAPTGAIALKRTRRAVVPARLATLKDADDAETRAVSELAGS
jgi:hypothetical protein